MQYPSNGGGVNVGQYGTDEGDRFTSWLRGEFAAANAIIDSLCHHLRSVGEFGEYDDVIGSIQQRRCNWNSVLHMQPHFSVAEVQYALQHATWNRQQLNSDGYIDHVNVVGPEKRSDEKDFTVAAKYNNGLSTKPQVNGNQNGFDSNLTSSACFKSEVKEVVCKFNPNLKVLPDVHLENDLYSTRIGPMKPNVSVTAKTFVATEMLDGKQINVVEGMKLYEKLFDDSEVWKMVRLVNDLRIAGRQGKFQGKWTYVVSNRPMKGHGKEIIQLGLPIANAPYEDEVIGCISKERKIEPISSLFQDVIDRLMALQAITVKPDSCIIDYFYEGQYSQPHTWPHWFGRPVSVLFLTECDMAFGILVGPHYPGEYGGSLNLSLTPGSMLVMEGRFADTRHAIPSTRKHRILVTFTKSEPKRSAPGDGQRALPPTRPLNHIPHPIVLNHHVPLPPTGLLPILTSAATPLMVYAPPRLPVSGTGVFLPPVGNRPAQRSKKVNAEEDCIKSTRDNGGNDMAAVEKGEQQGKPYDDLKSDQVKEVVAV
ncbi:RNA demethylase ALKBH10B-like [Rutidosis leptorrhynchoides]|uniref:RNA demethylase ALKBH10B-like n=1 Tax=Rutidosis leptorrhynchoides TaxID=125765 RepID=UPI003A99C174